MQANYTILVKITFCCLGVQEHTNPEKSKEMSYESDHSINHDFEKEAALSEQAKQNNATTKVSLDSEMVLFILQSF